MTIVDGSVAEINIYTTFWIWKFKAFYHLN